MTTRTGRRTARQSSAAQALVLVTVVALSASIAGAEEAPRVSVRIEGCEAGSLADVRRIIAVELRSSMVEPGRESRDTTRALVLCRDGTARISVVDPLTGKSLEREVTVEDTAPAARARLLALAVAELVTASWTELALSTPPAAPAVVAAPSARAGARRVVDRRLLERPSTGHWWLGPIFEWRTFPGESGSAGGIGARLARRIGRRFLVDGDLMVHLGSTDRAIGSVRSYTLSTSLAGGARVAAGRFEALLLAGLRGGLGRLEGDAGATTGVVAGSLNGGWLGPLGRLELALARSRAGVALGVEAGYALVGVRGLVEGDRRVAIDGAWVAIFLTPRFQLGR